MITSRHYFFDNLKRFFSLNKSLVFFIISIFLLGGITGVFCVVKSNSIFNILSIKDYALRLFLLDRISLFGYFFLKCLIILAVVFIIYFLSYFKFCGVLFTLLLIYLGFLLGVDTAIIIIVFPSLKGILISLLICLPIKIILFFFISVFAYKMISINCQISKYGNCYINGSQSKILLFVCLISIFIILVQTILLFILFNFFFI